MTKAPHSVNSKIDLSRASIYCGLKVECEVFWTRSGALPFVNAGEYESCNSDTTVLRHICLYVIDNVAIT